MKLLLDTHILLWWLADHRSLTSKARELISDASNLVFVSAVSIWEIRIKASLGKVSLPKEFAQTVAEEKFEKLPIFHEHAHALKDLPDIHRDPFDRLLISQAGIEGLTIVTHDKVFERYEVPVIRI